MKSSNYSQGPAHCGGVARQSLEGSLVGSIFSVTTPHCGNTGPTASTHLAPLLGVQLRRATASLWTCFLSVKRKRLCDKDTLRTKKIMWCIFTLNNINSPSSDHCQTLRNAIERELLKSRYNALLIFLWPDPKHLEIAVSSSASSPFLSR